MIYFWISNETMLFLPKTDFRLWLLLSTCTRAASELVFNWKWAKTRMGCMNVSAKIMSEERLGIGQQETHTLGQLTS